MSDTAAKIKKILQEIEKEDAKTDSLKSMDEVITILGGQARATGSSQSGLSAVQFNIDELKKWKDTIEKGHNIIYDRPMPGMNKIKKTVKRALRKAVRFVVDPMRIDQNAFNAAVMSAINILYNGAVVANPQKTSATIAEITRKQKEFDCSLKGVKFELEDKVAYLVEKNRELVGELEQQKEIISELKQSVETKEIISELKQSVVEVSQKADRQAEIFARFLRSHEERTEIPNIKETSSTIANPKDTRENDAYMEVDYFDFENHFRGSRDNIKKNQEIYLPYFEGKAEILDLGCGRGEFLELLKEHDISAKGVDLYPDFVYFCSLNGLSVLQGDAIEYLAAEKDNSLGGIMAAQLIEHLEIAQLFRLCTEAYKKLEHGAYLIAETPNPMCLATYMNSFYLDPSHNKPIHPKAMEYYLQKAGFKEIQILYTEASRSGYRLPLLNGEFLNNLAEFNDGIAFISDLLFGSQDYAIIAKK